MKGFPGRIRAALSSPQDCPMAVEWGSGHSCQPGWAGPKMASKRGGQGESLSSDDRSWGRNREKQKQKMSLFRKKVGLCSRYWHSLETAMLLAGATETGSYVSERSEGVPRSPGESFCGTLGAAKLGPADQNQQRTWGRREGHALEDPGVGCEKKGERGGVVREAPQTPP